MDYQQFIESKALTSPKSGFGPGDEISNVLYPFQRDIVKWACRKGRACIFADCGMGKTPMQLEWARQVCEHTRGSVLIVAPLAVSAQTVREGRKFGIGVTACRSQSDVSSGINITNYEMLGHFDPSAFDGVVLDESSILKAYMGKTKRSIVAAFKDTPYRLACTATPSPNDLMELLNHAEFLGVMESSKALSIWFISDQSQSGVYRLKGHAQDSFWRWVASWAVALSKPSDIGDYSDEGYTLPPLREVNEIVPVDQTIGSDSELFRKVVMSATGYQREKKITLKARCERSAEIANAADGQCVVWCYRNDESSELVRLIPDAIEVRGNDSIDMKERAIFDFIDGRVRVLVSKPSIFGFGINMQNCHEMVFCGMDYSFESYYQAVRRCYRFGQESPVTVHRVLGETELTILRTVEGKRSQHESMTDSIAARVGNAYRESHFTIGESARDVPIPDWMVTDEG